MNTEDKSRVVGAAHPDLRHMDIETLAGLGVPNIVYVREILAGELAGELGGQLEIPADTKLYSVHAANGERMAVVDDRDLAFAGAKQYDLEPVSVH